MSRQRTAWIVGGMAAAIVLAALPAATAAHAALAAQPAALTTVQLGGGDAVALPSPARLLDTAGGVGAPAHAVGANGTVSFVVAGRGGVPSAGVSAVIGRVRVLTPAAAGNATMYPNGAPRASAKTLQFGAGATRETLTVAVIGVGGRVILHNGSTRALQFMFDAAGYVPDTSAYTPLPAPARVLSATTGPLAAAAATTFSVGGKSGIPLAGVSALVARVTVVNPTTSGGATLYPAGRARPGTATLAWRAGAPTETLTMLALGSAGKLTLHNESTHGAGFNVDVLGFLADTSTFHALNAPARLLSTAKGVGAPAGPIAAGANVTIKIAGRSGVPASGIGTVVARVGVVSPVVAGNATVYRAGAARPGSTTLAYAAGATANTLTIVALSADGKVTLHNGATKPMHFNLDVLGWFDAVTAAQQSTKFVLPATTRLAGQNDIVAANADVTSVTLRPTADVPPVGGHLLVPPRGDGSRGITAEVLSAVAVSGGTTLTLAEAPVFDSVADMQVHDHRAVHALSQPAPTGTPGSSALTPAEFTGSSLGLHLADFGAFECSGDSLRLDELLPVIQLTLDGLRAEFDYSLSDRFIHFALIGTANGVAEIHIPGDYSCSASTSLPIDVPLGWLDASVGIGVNVGVSILGGTVNVNLTASAPAELGFEYSEGEMHNLSDLSFSGSSGITGTGTGATVTLTPFVELELGLITHRLVSPVIDVDLGMQLAVGPNPDGYFGPKCISVTVAPTISLSAKLEIAFFKDISASIGSYTLPPLHLFDGPCISYLGTIELHQDIAGSSVNGSSHYVQQVTMTFDGKTPAKVGNGAVFQPFTWAGTQVLDTAQPCGAHSHEVDTGPGAELSADDAQAFVVPDGPVPTGRVYTNFHEPPLTSDITGAGCDGIPYEFCCEGGGAIDVVNYDGFSVLPTLGPDGLAGPITGSGGGTSGDNTTTTQVTVDYGLTPVEATPS